MTSGCRHRLVAPPFPVRVDIQIHPVFSELFRNFADKLLTMQTIMTKEMAIDAWKKALEHKKEAGLKFEKWLQEKGIEGKVVTL